MSAKQVIEELVVDKLRLSAAVGELQKKVAAQEQRIKELQPADPPAGGKAPAGKPRRLRDAVPPQKLPEAPAS